MRGETAALRLTVPLKLFVPFTITVKPAEVPLGTDCDDGLAVMVKSGADTVVETTAACDRDVLFPVTVSE